MYWLTMRGLNLVQNRCHASSTFDKNGSGDGIAQLARRAENQQQDVEERAEKATHVRARKLEERSNR